MPGKEIKFRDKSDIAKHGFNEPKRICSVLECDDATRLRNEAFARNTTVAEIIRTLVRDYFDAQDRKEQKKKKDKE